jgi:hypothetical protein
MNTNQKKLKLVKEGIKTSTLNKMTDSQVELLFTRLLESKLEIKEIETITSTKVVATPDEVKKGVSIPGKTMAKMSPDGNKIEFSEDDDININIDSEKSADGMGMFEEKEIDEKFESKKQQKYFFAKCGDGKTKEQKKWCKMADEFAEKTNFAKLPEKKKETKEEFGMGDYNKKIASVVSNLHMKNLDQATTPNVEIFGESEIEKHIMRLVEKHITPKMSKKDFENLLEGDTKTAPAKPKVSPGTKPKHPFQPNPDKKGAPKAMKKEMDENTEVAPAKPKVSPGTTPKHPFAPDPSKQGAPKAIKRELPSFLKFDELGLNIK